jgi:pyridoxal phosphate enzyme (YggS family)
MGDTGVAVALKEVRHIGACPRCRALRPAAAAAAAHRCPARPQVLARVEAAAARAGRPRPRLVAVSKTKPAAAVAEAYAAGQRDFGENYVQELLDKAPALPADVRWHFIGHLQSNKARALVEGVPGLAMVETVDSEKLASRLDAAAAGAGRPPLAVLVQINTSGEASKHGVAPADAPALAAHVAARCAHLRLAGLMTIGQPDYTSRPENFERLAACRRAVAAATGLPEAGLELSMGMSGDFEAAIAMGATNVRVGSTIFGARQNPPPE